MSIKINKKGPKQGRILSKKGKLRGKWAELFIKYPNRFIIGSDLKYGQKRLAQTRVNILLNQLPENIARKIAFENALEIFNIDDR